MITVAWPKRARKYQSKPQAHSHARTKHKTQFLAKFFFILYTRVACSVEEAQDLSSCFFAPCFFVVHDTTRSRQYKKSETHMKRKRERDIRKLSHPVHKRRGQETTCTHCTWIFTEIWQEDKSPPNEQRSILSDKTLRRDVTVNKGPTCFSYMVFHDFHDSVGRKTWGQWRSTNFSREENALFSRKFEPMQEVQKNSKLKI